MQKTWYAVYSDLRRHDTEKMGVNIFWLQSSSLNALLHVKTKYGTILM